MFEDWDCGSGHDHYGNMTDNKLQAISYSVRGMELIYRTTMQNAEQGKTSQLQLDDDDDDENDWNSMEYINADRMETPASRRHCVCQ